MTAAPKAIVATVSDLEDRVDGRARVIKTFRGPGCEDRAAAFIGTLPGHASGRYDLDIGHCGACGAHHDAADDYPDLADLEEGATRQ